MIDPNYSEADHVIDGEYHYS